VNTGPNPDAEVRAAWKEIADLCKRLRVAERERDEVFALILEIQDTLMRVALERPDLIEEDMQRIGTGPAALARARDGRARLLRYVEAMERYIEMLGRVSDEGKNSLYDAMEKARQECGR